MLFVFKEKHHGITHLLAESGSLFPGVAHLSIDGGEVRLNGRNRITRRRLCPLYVQINNQYMICRDETYVLCIFIVSTLYFHKAYERGTGIQHSRPASLSYIILLAFLRILTLHCFYNRTPYQHYCFRTEP